MIHKLLVIATLLGLSVPMYADHPDTDVMMHTYREEFRRARPISEEALALLHIGRPWSCTGNYATRNKSYDGQYYSDMLNFSFDYEMLNFREANVNKTGSWRFNHMIFAKSGLYSFSIANPEASAVQRNLEYLYANLRMAISPTGRNGLVIEVYSSARNLYPPADAEESIEAKGFPATEYYFCEDTDRNNSEMQSISGFCKVNDDDTETEEGGCLHKKTGLVWSMSILTPTPQLKAEEECEDLKDGNRKDWRLPTELELLELAEYSDLVRTNFSLDDNVFYWARDLGNAPFGWVVSISGRVSKYILKDEAFKEFPAAEPAEKAPRMKNNLGYVCVRSPMDSDGDKIPDSSDYCPNTPRTPLGTTPVSPSGANKGCATNEQPIVL